MLRRAPAPSGGASLARRSSRLESSHGLFSRRGSSSSRACSTSKAKALRNDGKGRRREKRSHSAGVEESAGRRSVLPREPSSSNKTSTYMDNHIKVMSDSDLPKLVSFFRQASPYIGQHFGKTFVLMVPGYLIQDDGGALDRLLEDVALLQNLGVKLCLVVGATASIDKVLKQMGEETEFVDGYRITTASAMQAVRQAAGATRIEIESKLSKFFPAGSARRHGYNRNSSKRDSSSAGARMKNGSTPPQMSMNHQRPPVQVVSGNFVMAKYKGVVGGVNYEFTGEVKNVWADAILQHMDQNQVVIVNNLGYTESGDVLNCNSFEVARRVSQALKADKLIIYHGEKIAQLNLPAWIGLSDDSFVWLSSSVSSDDDLDLVSKTRDLSNAKTGDRIIVDSNVPELSLAIQVCEEGVPRTHLINASTDGALFLELYTRDGLGTMVSMDLYEGMRSASPRDYDNLLKLLKPMESAGTLIQRSKEEIKEEIENFTVIEREGRLIGCCLLKKIDKSVGEIAAFVVHEQFRTEHRGDALLDYVEQKARNTGLKTLILLTTRTGDWFAARGFKRKGTAHLAHGILPEERLSSIDPDRKSMLFVKVLDTRTVGPPGSRIGF